jgi:hypothetical protein
MKAILTLGADLHADVMEHLLQPKSDQEQAAFLFAREDRAGEQLSFEVIEAAKLAPSDFVTQEGYYLEMTDETSARVIKRAHDLGASLVEMHSHLDSWPAGFSLSDRMGLKETVSHMWWRLKGRPYLAIVVAPTSFDALLWLDNPHVPQALDGVFTGGRFLRPTNNSLNGW